MEIEFNKQHKITQANIDPMNFEKTKSDDDIQHVVRVIFTKHFDEFPHLVDLAKSSNIPIDIEGMYRETAAEEIYDDLISFSKAFPAEKEIKSLINIMRPSIALMNKSSDWKDNSINEYKKAINQLTPDSPPLFIQGGWKSIDKFRGHNTLYVIRAYEDINGEKKLEFKLINRGAGCENHKQVETRHLVFKEETKKKIISAGFEPDNINDIQAVVKLVQSEILNKSDLQGIGMKLKNKVQNFILNDIDPAQFLNDGWFEKLMSPISESQEINSEKELTEKGTKALYGILEQMVAKELAQKVDSVKPSDAHSVQKSGTCSVRPLQGWISENVPKGTMRKFRLFSLEKDLVRLYKFFIIHKNTDKLFLELERDFPEIYEKIDKNIQSDIKKETNLFLKLSKIKEIAANVLLHQEVHIEKRLQEAISNWPTHPLTIYNTSNEYQAATGNYEPELDIGSILPVGGEEIRQFNRKISSLINTTLSDEKKLDRKIPQITQEDLIDHATNKMDLIGHILFTAQSLLTKNL